MRTNNEILAILLLILLTLGLVVSGLNSYDRTTWLLEVFPVLIALPILIFTHKKYPLSRLLYPNNLGRFIDWSKKTASYDWLFFLLNRFFPRPCTDVTP